MGNIQKTLAKISAVVNMIADWFLILAGLVLVLWSFISVDVTEARYLLIIVGLGLTGSGCWFRHLSRKRRKERLQEQ